MWEAMEMDERLWHRISKKKKARKRIDEYTDGSKIENQVEEDRT